MNEHENKHCNPIKTILHLIDTTGPGGAETVFIQLADLLRHRGYKSVVVIRGPGWVQQELERRGLMPTIIDVKGGFALGFLWKLLLLVRREKVDVIQSHLLGSNVYAAMVGLLTGTPVVATYHGMVDVNPRERFRSLKHKVMQWGIRQYIAVSGRLMESIRQQNLLDAGKAQVIYNGIDTSRYHKISSDPVRAELGLPDNAVLVGSLGNVRPAKAYDVLIAAAAKVVAVRPEVHFLVAGHQKESLMAELSRQIGGLSLDDNMHFIGFCQNCAEFLGQMDCFVLSSSSEGFSISTIEAMATGLPVLVTRCGGPEEIVEDSRTGWMVPVNDPDLLAEALLSLLGDAPMREAVAAAGREHARQKFGVDTMLNGYSAIYNRL